MAILEQLEALKTKRVLVRLSKTARIDGVLSGIWDRSGRAVVTVDGAGNTFCEFPVDDIFSINENEIVL